MAKQRQSQAFQRTRDNRHKLIREFQTAYKGKHSPPPPPQGQRGTGTGPREAVLSPALEVFQTWQDQAQQNLVPPHSWSSCEQEAGLQAWQCCFQPERSWEVLFPTVTYTASQSQHPILTFNVQSQLVYCSAFPNLSTGWILLTLITAFSFLPILLLYNTEGNLSTSGHNFLSGHPLGGQNNSQEVCSKWKTEGREQKADILQNTWGRGQSLPSTQTSWLAVFCIWLTCSPRKSKQVPQELFQLPYPTSTSPVTNCSPAPPLWGQHFHLR